MLTGVLCTVGVVRSTGFAARPPAVESLVSDLDPHRDDINARSVELRLEHTGVSQGASWYRDEFDGIVKKKKKKIYSIAKRFFRKQFILLGQELRRRFDRVGQDFRDVPGFFPEQTHHLRSGVPEKRVQSHCLASKFLISTRIRLPYTALPSKFRNVPNVSKRKIVLVFVFFFEFSTSIVIFKISLPK